MKYKKWTLEKKLKIIASYEEIRVVETCRKYSVSKGTFYSWKKKFDNNLEAVILFAGIYLALTFTIKTGVSSICDYFIPYPSLPIYR
jgi:hypothetical protein